jgi:hypothetical protein
MVLERFQNRFGDLSGFHGTAEIGSRGRADGRRYRPAVGRHPASGDSWSFSQRPFVGSRPHGAIDGLLHPDIIPLHDSSEVDLARLPDMIRDTIWAKQI